MFSRTTLGSLQTLLVVLLPMSTCGQLTSDLQLRNLWLAKVECDQLIINATRPDNGELYCPPLWDNVMCWPNYTLAGQTARQKCADYIQGFRSTEMAERYCEQDGEWKKHRDFSTRNSSWTNYTLCHGSDVPSILISNMYIIKRIYTVGYSVSLVCLALATFTMIFLKRLHCQRNTIHINLFASFIFRAVISLLREGLFVNDLSLAKDLILRSDGSYKFNKEGLHWECKLINTMWQYSLCVNYMWIFVEGLYLHTLVFFAVFSQSQRFFKIYIIIGWVFPLIFVIAWVIVRVHANDIFCWNTHEKGYFWILNGPIITSISINFFFFLNIIRMLFTKLHSTNSRDPGRYRKLAKSTLVLIPLFGVYYIYFIAVTYQKDLHFSIIHLYMEMTLNSFQGTIIAFLFCFLNGEVRAEILKKWNRHWLRRQSLVSSRSSRAFSTTSFYIGRERASLSQGPGVHDLAKETPPSSPSNNNNPTKFHKVSSLPKMPFGGSSIAKTIPRVASSPKVTFSSFENSVFIGENGSSSSKLKNGVVSNGMTKEEEVQERKTIVMNGFPPARKDFQESVVQKVIHKGARETASMKSKAVNGEGSPQMLHVSSVTVLPPLMDEEEEISETSQML